VTGPVGILFATPMEADSFLEQTKPDHCVVTISGMGMEAACFAARQLIEDHGVACIVNPGICGALDNSLERGSVHFVSRVWTEHPRESVSIQQTPGAKRLVTVDKPVFEEDRKTRLATFADLVDMEGFAVARQCQTSSIPCVLIKGVTDFGDSGGKAHIKKHLASVSEKVTAVTLHYLKTHNR
jgi:nucleoside phosphorylase